MSLYDENQAKLNAEIARKEDIQRRNREALHHICSCDKKSEYTDAYGHRDYCPLSRWDFNQYLYIR